MNTPSDLFQSVPAGHWRYGDLAILDRQAPLPDRCILTAEPAAARVGCLFHLPNRPLEAGIGPLETLLLGLVQYFRDVPKAAISLPLSAALLKRRRFAWFLLGIVVVWTVATAVALLWGQAAIKELPQGPQRTALDNWLIPGIAVAGLIGILVPALMAQQIMPMLTVQLRPKCITPTHLCLEGVAPDWLALLSEWKPAD